MDGMVFDIKELALFDGPGIRTTVFLKGCPLNCSWCHNPEGLSPESQLMVSTTSCIECGTCIELCPHDAEPTLCTACGLCIPHCPLHLRRISGVRWSSTKLAEELLRNKDILERTGGGITFSGGEPLMQHRFVLETREKLNGLHCTVETCGYVPREVFRDCVETFDYIIIDIKMMDAEKHEKYCGRPNGRILDNISYLKTTQIPFTVRIPVIPNVNDSDENFAATAEFLASARNLTRVELLPYQNIAGVKYRMLSRTYTPLFDEHAEVHLNTDIFIEHGIPCTIL